MTIHNQQRYRDIQVGDVVAIEHNWVKSFALIPHKTIGKKYMWLKKCYVRRVWVYTGFIDEPETQYGNLIDVIKTL